MRSAASWAILLVAATSGCAARAPRARVDSAPRDTAAILASAKPDIELANAAWVPGLRARNADTIVAAYSDSGLFIAADGAVIRGRKAIGQMYASRFPRLREILAGGVVQDGLAVAGQDLVYEWGHAWLEMVGATPGAASVRSGGSYFTVWKREADGHWHIIRNLSFPEDRK